MGGVTEMGGCQAAVQVGWGALCGVTQAAGRMQSWADRVTSAVQSVTALGPLQTALILVLALVALAAAWQVFLVLAQVLYRVYPYVIAVGVLVLLFGH